jgi:glycosyltransferase involved in cell wall biosynthesis
MRVLLVISDLALHGAQKQVVELARELDRIGHAVAIYTLNDDVPRAAELQGSGVEVVVDQKRTRLDLAVIRRMHRKIVDFGAQVVHGFLYDADIYVRLAAIGTGATVLNSERSDNYEVSRLQMLAHRLTRGLVDGVVANSQSGSRFAQRYFGYRERDMHVVWNGMRVDELRRKAVSAKNYREEFFGPGPVKIACMVGHIKPAKDYPLALEVAAALTGMDPEWRVLFLGESLAPAAGYAAGRDTDTSGYKRAVMQQYQALGLESGGRVKFAGARADAPAILAQCDVQLMTSRWEGFPNVVLEGMVLGVPVVSTDYSDIRLILPRASQVVASRAPAEIALAIVKADREREAIVAEQESWVHEHASIEQAAHQLEQVYEQYVRRDAQAHAA